MDERHEIRALTIKLWVYGDGKETNADSGADLSMTSSVG